MITGPTSKIYEIRDILFADPVALSAGCVVTYQIDPTYIGSTVLPTGCRLRAMHADGPASVPPTQKLRIKTQVLQIPDRGVACRYRWFRDYPITTRRDHCTATGQE